MNSRLKLLDRFGCFVVLSLSTFHAFLFSVLLDVYFPNYLVCNRCKYQEDENSKKRMVTESPFLEMWIEEVYENINIKLSYSVFLQTSNLRTRER